MGLFDIFKEANEDAHGARLERGMQDTIRLLESFDEDIRLRALHRFVDKRTKLLSNIRNMTSKGCIDMGKYLQNEARKKYDIDLTESCALWMAGAWLESMERKSIAACDVHKALNNLSVILEEAIIHDQEKNINIDNAQNITIFPDMPDISKCHPIKRFDIGEYTAVLVRNAPNVAGYPDTVEYMYVMALFADSDPMPIYYVTAEKSLSGKILLCAFDQTGNHDNFGCNSDWSDINTFSTEALSILREEAARYDVPF